MSLFLTFAFLFFVGSVSGWVLELLFRKYIAAGNPEHKWINPGFCTGPYLPLYGCGLCILYLLASFEQTGIIENPFWSKILLFIFMAICMTATEYIAGILALKTIKVRLWDYSDERWNLQGIICPKFTLLWAVLSIIYYFAVHPFVNHALGWLSDNLAFSFIVGLFFGVFIIDAAHSVQLVAKLKKYAEENNVVVRYEAIKTHIRGRYDETRQKYNFFRPFRSDKPLYEHLKELRDSFETRKKKIKK